MEAARQFFQFRAADLLAAREFIEAAVAAKGMPPAGLPASSVVATAAATLVLGWLLAAVILSRRIRKTMMDIVDTTVVSAIS